MTAYKPPAPGETQMTINAAANDAVIRVIDHLIKERSEIGVQVAAYLHGELVVDAWGGLADPDAGRPVDGDTLFNVYSVTKGVAATALHIQAERGLIDYDKPVAAYWPEYGANGKDKVTVRDALSHRTGTPQMPEGATPESICDWDKTAAAIAALKPIFPPGEQPAYQSISFGWVIGEIVRRVDEKKRSFRDFVLEEICAPYDIKDLWIGIPDDVEARIAKGVDGTNMPAPPAGSLLEQSLPNAIRLAPNVFDRPDVRRACIAGVGGIFNARSEARFWAILANGGELDGKRLLSRERIDMACKRRAGGEQPDPVYFGTVMPLSQGGYWLYDGKTSFTDPVKAARGICSPGAGASLGWADPDTGLAVAFCHNYMSAPMTAEAHPATPIADAIRSSLGLS
jgi:CubicO group peptidase (beta-lactamase class C family)